jgi:hypothetical protein
MSGILQKGARRFTTQIGAAGVPDAVATTIPLVSTTGLPTDTEIEVIIDRTDGSGILTPSKEEVVRGTVSGLNLINCIRGVEGTAQAHGAGATVNSFLTASMWNNVIDYIRDTPSRGLIGGVINVSVASNNLTVAVKTLQGTDPSPTNPVGIIIGNQLRSITSALSVTSIAGTNWLNMGSAELATREVDLFTFMQWNSTTSAVNILVSRLPYSRLMGDFVNSGTNEKGVFGIVNYNATDNVVNIGRFAATLSAGAGHTWSVPTFDNANLIQEPIYETRWLDYTPQISYQFGSVNPTSNTINRAKYMLTNTEIVNMDFKAALVVGSMNRAITEYTLPFNYKSGVIAQTFQTQNTVYLYTGGFLSNLYGGGAYLDSGNKFIFYAASNVTYSNGNFAISGQYYI